MGRLFQRQVNNDSEHTSCLFTLICDNVKGHLQLTTDHGQLTLRSQFHYHLRLSLCFTTTIHAIVLHDNAAQRLFNAVQFAAQ